MNHHLVRSRAHRANKAARTIAKADDLRNEPRLVHLLDLDQGHHLGLLVGHERLHLVDRVGACPSVALVHPVAALLCR